MYSRYKSVRLWFTVIMRLDFFFLSSSEDVVVKVDCQLVEIQSHLRDRPPDPPELWAASLPGADVLNSI